MTNSPTGSGRGYSAGRGRPAFNQAARTMLLDALTAGAKLGEAAAKAGVSRNVPAQHAKTDPAFAAALAEAKATGRTVRAATRPHSEGHYNHDGCRAPECRAKATAARTARRREAADAPEEEPAQPIPITDRGPGSSPSFSLARAS